MERVNHENTLIKGELINGIDERNSFWRQFISLEKLENHFVIRAGSLGSQILKNYTLSKTDGSKSEELMLTNIENFFFKLLSGEISVQELTDKVNFEDLKKSFE